MAEKLKNWSGVKQINDRFDFKNSRCFSNKQILTVKEPFLPSDFSQEGPKLDLKNSNSEFFELNSQTLKILMF